MKGNVILAATSADSRDCYIKINDNSTVTIEGDITMGSNSTRRNYIWFAGDGTINIGGSFNGGFTTRENGSGTATTNFGTGTIGYINTKTPGTPQTVLAYTYNNLVLGEGNYIAAGEIRVTKNFKTDGIFDTNQKNIRFNGTTECGNGTIEANYENVNTYYAPTAQYIIKGNYRGLIFNDGARGTHYTCGNIAVYGRTYFNNTSRTEIHTEHDIRFNSFQTPANALIYASENSTVTYSNSQNIIGGEYYNLVFANGNDKIPYGDILVNGTMTWNSGRFLMYNDGSTYNFTLGSTATISSSNAFASGHCFVFPYKATEGFVTIKGNVSRLNGGTIPIGNINGTQYTYRPVTLTGTTTGESSFSVRPTNGGSVTGNPTDLQCYWTTESENIENVTLVFQHIAADYPNGSDLHPFHNDGSEWQKWSDEGCSNNTITFDNCTPTGQWSACEDIKTYYSFTTGNWDDASSWTFDPTGIDRANPSYIPTSGPTEGSRVVIKNPDKITVRNNNINLMSLTINEGGELILGGTTGHVFGDFRGQGTLKIASNQFPTVSSYNGFIRKGGGTVEYCNTSSFTMPNQATYNNLVINITGTATLASNLTTNGYFTIKKGTFQIGNTTAGTTTPGRTILVNGDLTVEQNGSITTNTLNVSNYGSSASYNNAANTYGHKLELKGNFTNNGIVDFSNMNAANYSAYNRNVTNVFFTNDKGDQTVTINNTTKFYTIRVQKGTDKTHVLNIEASAANLFQLHGPRTGWNYGNSTHTASQYFLALAIEAGTVRLGHNITIDALMSGGNNYAYKLDETARLWIDGATVTVGTCFSLYVHGDIKVSSTGKLYVATNEGIVYRTTANMTLDDEGLIESTMLRTSMATGTHMGSLTINGGIFRLTGNDPGKGDFPTFGLTYSNSAFNMSGGELIINRGTRSGNAECHALVIGSNPDNCSITGGTIKLPCLNWGNNNKKVYINSTVPFWNLEIEAAAAANTVTIMDFDNHGNGGCDDVPISSLVVLNNLTISNRGTLNANGQNVYVGGNFTINNTATYTPGNNTTFFNGSNVQNFTNGGTVTNGFNNLTLAENARLTLQSGATVRGTLTLESNSVLNELQNTLTVTGNIVSNSGVQYNSGSSTGCILLSGTANQTIGGDGNGSFNNLHINKTGGTVALTANAAITGNLRLISNTNLNIGTYNLNLCDADAAIYSDNTTGTNFSANKMIQTSGNSSDGGITILYNTTADYLFPFGYGGNYLPATIAVDVEPTTYGSITSRPVNGKHYVFGNTIDALRCYWHNTSSGFVGVTSVNHHYKYEQALAGTGENSYVPAYYKNGAWYPNNTDGLVNYNGNYFFWESCATIDGDFTCGVPTAFSQAPTRLYSAKSGRWDRAENWSTEVGGAGGAGVPGANTIVVIGDATHQHTMTIESDNSAYSGSLSIAEGSTLDLKTYRGQNFGLLAENGDVDGSGTLIIRRNNYFPDGDFGDFLAEGGGTVEYNASNNDITPAASVTSYNNLRLVASNNHKVTLPNANIEVAGNLISRGTNVNTYNNFNSANASRTVVIDGDLNVETGTLAFYSSAVQNLVVKGDINVSSGANFNVKQTTNFTNQLTIYGDMDVDGNLNFVNSNQEVATTFTGTADAAIKGSGDITLYTLTCDKGTDATPVLSIERDIDASYQNGVFLDLRNGTFRANGDVNIDITQDADLEIGSTACLSTQSGTFNICNVNNDTRKLLLHGKLEVLGGNMNIGDGSHGSDIEYQSALAQIDVRGGTLTVGGQIRRSYNVTTGDLHYSQSDGNVVILGQQRDRGQTQKRALIEVCNNGSFNMSGGKITLVGGALNNASYADVLLTPATSSATGGTIAFGSSGSTDSYTFYMNASAELGNIEIGTDSQEQTLTLVTNHVDINGSLAIEEGSVFDANGFNVEIAGNISCKTSDGFIAGDSEQLTTLNGTATQKITGDGNNINFANLTIDNPTTTQLNDVNVNCNGLLTISRGALDDAGNSINALTSVVNNSRHISSAEGGGLVMKGSGTHELRSSSGKSGIYGNLTIKSRTEMKNPITVTGLITLNSDLYANDYSVKMMQSSRFAGNSSGMIILNGAIGDAGVRKYFADGFSGEFVFRIGISEHYTPAVYNFTSAVTSSDGYINVKPMNKLHSNIETTPVNYLEYYWMVETEGLSGYTVTHEYFYTDDLMVIADPSYDLLAQRFDGTWENMTTGSVLTDENKILITGLTLLTGEYTAGSPIYQKLPTYYSVGSGNWTNPATWQYEEPAGSWHNAQHAPNGNPIVIRGNHTVTMDALTPQCAYSVEIKENGTLDIGSTIGHNLGFVKGGGTLKVYEINGGGGVYSFMIPAGKYDDFFSTSTSTIQFDGDHAAVLPAKPGNYEKPLQNVRLTGNGAKTITSSVFYVKGNVTIDNNSKLDNSANNRDFYLGGNFVDKNTTTSGYISGTGKIIFVGTETQNIDIKKEVSFYNVQINNEQGVDVTNGGNADKNVIIINNLTLTNGVFKTNTAALIYLSSTNQNVVSGGSSSSFVDGPLRKKISTSGSFDFPVGNGDRYGNVKLTNVNNGSSSAADWTAQYFNANPLTVDDEATFNATTLGSISDNEYWIVNRPNNSCSAKVALRWDEQSCTIFNTISQIQQGLKMVEYDGSSEWVVRDATASGTAASGMLTTTSAITQENYTFTFGYAGVIATITTTTPQQICNDGIQTASINVSLSGTAPFTLSYRINGGTPFTQNVLESSYTISRNSSQLGNTAGTYEVELLSISDATTVGHVSTATGSIEVLAAYTPTFTDGGGVSVAGTGETRTYEVITHEGSTYHWEWSGDGPALANPNVNPISVTYGNTPATYTLVVTETAASECVLSNTLTITISNTPQPSFTAVANICIGDEITYATANIDRHSYQWYLDGSPMSGETSSSMTKTWNDAGTHTIYVYEENAEGVGNTSDEASITIYAKPASPTINDIAAICSGTATNVTLSTTQNNVIYRLYRDGTDNSLNTIYGNGSSQSFTTPTITVEETETVNLYVVASNLGCNVRIPESNFKPLVVNEVPDATFDWPTIYKGVPTVIAYRNNTSTNFSSFSIDYSAGGTDVPTTNFNASDITITANGDIAGIITITNDNNCSADFEFNKPISDGYVWRGSASTEWSNAGNWYSNAVPNNEHGAVIRTATNLPVISTTANAKSVKIESGKLTISGDHTLNVYGDWQNEVGNDGFVGTSSTVAFKNDAEISGNTTFNNISTETGKTVNIGSGQVTATGNVTNAGTLTGSNGTTLVMSGSGEATMTGGTYNLASLTIDKSDGITSNADLNVGGTFAINAGVLTMVDDHKVNLGANATATSGGETAYVDGTMTKTGSSAVTFPIGNNGRRAMVGIEPSGANESTLFTASYIYTPKEEVETPDEAPAKVEGLKRVSSMDRWNITGNASSYLTLYWDNGTISEIGDPATLVVAHWSASNNQWEMFETNALDGTTAASGGIKTRGLVSSYSPFAFGATDDGINALPVELVGYTGRQNGNTVELEWATLSEKDNDFFEIERSTDGINFVTIGFVQGAGNSTEKLAYSFADNAPERGLVYYRLSQVDYDGTRSFADRLISVVYTTDGNISLTVVPNPTRGQFSVRITGAADGIAKLLTQSGKQIRIVDIRNITESIDISDLPNGIYILQYQSGENVVHERVVKL